MADPVLPSPLDEAAFDHLLRQADVWRPAIEAICQRHGLEAQDLAPFDTGSSVLWALGQTHVIKLMPPFWAADCRNELMVLRQLQGQPDLPVPRLLAQGELEGWPYFIMSRLPGQFASALWSSLDAPTQTRLIEALGRLLRTLHQVPVEHSDALEAISVDWPAFVSQQLAGFLPRQLGYGIPEPLARELHACLAEQAQTLAAFPQRVLMHCEIMPEHVLLSNQAGEWVITGLIDFGDPMIGFHEYEFGGVFVFFTAGRPELRRAFLRSYGYAEAELNDETARRLMAGALLHRFGTVPLGLRLMKRLDLHLSFYETFFSL